MAKTRKKIQTLNLYKYDVLIEDRGPRSEYFKLAQFTGYFSGGRNAFLIAGSGTLRANSNILVEVLNKNGSTVYSVPIKQYTEGNSRLIQVDVYEDTPIGPGKIVVLGSIDRFADGTPVPPEWQNKYNVRWIADVTIAPLNDNTTPIRFAGEPAIEVFEKFYAAPISASFTQSILQPVDVELTQKTYNVVQNGYTVRITGPTPQTRFFSEYIGGRITGSIQFVGPSGPETASVSLPITRIYNRAIAVSEPVVLTTDKSTAITPRFISASGTYVTDVFPYGALGVTSSVNLEFSQLNVNETGPDVSYAQIRVVNLSTLSGQVKKVRLSYTVATEPGEFTILGDANASVGQLLSIDSGSRVVSTGKLRNVVLDDYWYSATMSVQKNEVNPVLPPEYYTSSLVTTSTFLNQCCTTLLDSVNATPPIETNTFINNVSYFIGSRQLNSVRLFPRNEYSLKFNAFVSRTSASVELIQSDYSLEVYLVPLPNEPNSQILDTEPRGQLLGTVTPSPIFQNQNFETVEFIFTPKITVPSNYGLRFVVYGGYWDIADISLAAAEEAFFNPDEVTILTSNDFKFDDVLQFKVEYLDVDNNSTGIETTSIPTYFTGSTQLLVRQGVVARPGDLEINGLPIYQTLLQDHFTGLISGGVITTSSVYSQAYTISAGAGFYIDNSSNPLLPVYKYVAWPELTLTASAFPTSGAVATYPRTQIAIQPNNEEATIPVFGLFTGKAVGGTVIEQVDPFTVEDYRQYIVLGRIAHVNSTNIQRTLSLPLTVFARQYHWFDLAYSLGIINLSGNAYQAGSTDLTVQKTAGQTYRIGSNYKNTPSFPDITTDPASNPTSFAYRYRSATPDVFTEEPVRTTIVPNLYDDGTGTLDTVNNNQWTIQRIYFFGATRTTRIQYGQAIYNSFADATAGVTTEIFQADPNLQRDASLRALLLVRGGATNLSVLADAEFIEATAGLGGTSGGGGATSLEALSDVSADSRVNNDVLVYNSVSGQWENQPQAPTASLALTLTDPFSHTGSANFSGSLRVVGTAPSPFIVSSSNSAAATFTSTNTNASVRINTAGAVPISSIELRSGSTPGLTLTSAASVGNSSILAGTNLSLQLGANGDTHWEILPNGNLVPNFPTDTYDIGSSTQRIKNLYLSGFVSASSYTSSLSNQVGFLGTSSFAVSSSRALTSSVALSVNYDTITNRPTLVSASSQISYTGLSNIPAGILSSSTQINNLSGVSASFATSASRALTSSLALSVNYDTITNRPALVSASSQIAHNSTTGYVANEHINHTSVSITAGTGLTGGGDLTATRTVGLTGQALALHNLSTNGLIARTGAATVAGRTVAVAGTGLSIANGNGVSGNPTITIGGGVVSASSQISYTGVSSIPAGILSSSTQINNLSGVSASFATSASRATTSSFALNAISFIDTLITPTELLPYEIDVSDVGKRLVVNNTTGNPIINTLTADTTAIAVGSRVQIAAFKHYVTINAIYSEQAIDLEFNPDANNTVRAIAVQSDGKILIGGDFTTVGGTTLNRIARLNSDGTLDTFNPNANGTVNTIAVQSDGKILIGGVFSTVDGTTRNRIARLNSDGTLDVFNPNVNGTVNTIVVESGGTILTGGDFTTIGITTRNRIARLNSDGTLAVFNPSANGTVRAIVVESGGTILTGGDFTTIGGAFRNRIARLLVNAAAEPAFNPNVNAVVRAIAVQSDGKILIGGDFTTVGGTTRNYIARLNSDGTLDTFNPNANGTVNTIAVQSDGKILIGGSFTTVGGTTRLRIARLNSDGTLDTGFSPVPNQFPEAIAIQSNGKILIGGNFTTVRSTTRNRIARVGGPDPLTSGNDLIRLPYAVTPFFLPQYTVVTLEKIVAGEWVVTDSNTTLS